ncbi:cell division protein [Bifidobacterium saguini DSM 23967]|uniref:Cell division protein n=2 Tax=Bifidobacterium saguini TaxID=762210 RepID=A0A087D837_9BIFI|nr:FtsW/RodA/SpoVE family cell cycle protein [Bifidobacterium saguini]KFI91687.1 cell division protein [Bifidobacterium saguini DSM 23967]QTB91904.1 FtsW/RodA/SpoVE family cell cycle protein [Bifidobacterium saguini]
MIATRLRQIGLLLVSMAISALAFIQMFERTTNSIPSNYLVILCVAAALFLVLWALTVRFQPYASQAIIPCVLLLTGIGVTMIARIDQSMSTRVAQRQLMWLCIALVLSALIIVFLKDYRVLRRFSYVSMVVGLVLLLSPMLPVLGQEVNGARIWVKVPGLGQFQPGEFAKLFLAFFFAAYLFDHRDQLAVGGKKVLGLQLPRIKDLGPIIVVWVASMGVLVMQHDLGTSLMFFAMFVAMLYVATGRKSWIVIGLLAFAVGAVLAASMFSHVGQRVDAWLHPFSNEQYNKEYGGSWQLVTGIFGLASGGMVGTGLGQGHPALTTFANSDFIYTALGEELGLAGVLAILMLYLIIIASGFIAAMKIKDGFGKLLASGLVFTMAFQVFTVVGGVTLVIPLTGLTLPYMAAGGSSLIANYVLAALLIVISDAANQPEPELTSESLQYEALAVLRDKELEERARATEPIARPRTASATAANAYGLDDPSGEIVDTTRRAPESTAGEEYTAPTGTLPPVPPTAQTQSPQMPHVPQVPQVPPIPPANGYRSTSNHHGPRHGGARA